MFIDYQSLIDEAMLGIVKKVLKSTCDKEKNADQSYYVSFRTDDPSVVLSKRIKQKYPREITIVLQYQFRDLFVHDDHFSVNISFGGVPETVIVPFNTLTSFIDPEANFSLQFRRNDNLDEIDVVTGSNARGDVKEVLVQDKNSDITKKDENKLGEVILFEKFRKKIK
ncbi:MAG: aminotransferase [Rickettsiales bacterium]|nr:aminotransferase [Rickettsiales bacterium]MCA0254940.1 ClpXP protease specificity-enhancing factor SspB [Pseudomonadota bacterium]